MNDTTEKQPEPDSERQNNQSSIAGPGAKYPLAGRLERLGAAMLDNLIVTLAVVPLAVYLDVSSYVEAQTELPTDIRIKLTFAVFAAFLILNGHLLSKYGQTIGKRYMKIAMVDIHGHVPNFNHVVATRYAPFWFMGLIPVLSLIPVIEVLTIFREDKRCVHDLFAGTRVIDVSQSKNRRAMN